MSGESRTYNPEENTSNICQTEKTSRIHYENEDMDKAAYYMSSEGGRNWHKGAEFADKACAAGMKQAYIASIFCHKKIAETLTEDDKLVEAAHEWKAVFDRAVLVQERLQKGDIELKDFEHSFIGTAQDNALYGIALSLYIGLLEKEKEEDKDIIVNSMVEALECVDTPKAKLMLGLGYDMQDKRKQAAKLLRRVLETTDYANEKKEDYEEFVYFHAVICLAFYYRDGIPNYIDKNTRQAVVTLDNGINSVTNENLKRALAQSREEYVSGEGEQTKMVKADVGLAIMEDEFVMGNGTIYSRSRMEKSVDLCSRRLGLKRIIEESKTLLNTTYVTDEKYIDSRTGDKAFGYGVAAFFIADILSYLILRGLRHVSEVLYAIIVIACSIGAAFLTFKYIGGKQEEEIRSSEGFLNYQKEREWRNTHTEELKGLINASSTELYDLEKCMQDRNACIFPQTYWGVAGYLWSYIQAGRANNLTEAINLYEDLQHQERVSGVLGDISRTAMRTQELAEQAGFEAAQARLAADRAASYADDARFWSMLSYFSNKRGL